jgi:hypothetical protein
MKWGCFVLVRNITWTLVKVMVTCDMNTEAGSDEQEETGR